MRLSQEKIGFLKKEILRIKPDADVYLFGSRTDNNKKGGDIDILIITAHQLTTREKSNLLMQFWNKFGEQRLDLVCFTPESNAAFKQLALLNAIKL